MEDFKMRKKIVVLFTGLLIAVGVIAVIKPINAASNGHDGFYYQDCISNQNCSDPSDCIYHDECLNKHEQNCLQEKKMNQQTNQNCSKNHQHRDTNNCVSQNNQNDLSTDKTHHKHQMHHK